MILVNTLKTATRDSSCMAWYSQLGVITHEKHKMKLKIATAFSFFSCGTVYSEMRKATSETRKRTILASITWLNILSRASMSPLLAGEDLFSARSKPKFIRRR